MEIERGFIFDPNLVLYLPLYKLDGASFMSRDAYGHLCTVTGALWRPNGRYFDGDDHIDCSDIPAFDGSLATLSVCAWLKPDGVSSSQCIVSKYNVAPNRTFYCQINSNASGRALAAASGATFNALYNDTGAGMFTAGTWHFTTFLFDLASENIDIYLAGSEQPSSKGTAGTPPTVFNDTATAVYLGARADGSMPLTGYIGEIWLYNRLLSGLEISHIYNATKWRYR